MLRYESQQAQHSVKETHCRVLYRHEASHCKRSSSRHNNDNILSRKTSSESFIKHIFTNTLNDGKEIEKIYRSSRMAVGGSSQIRQKRQIH